MRLDECDFFDDIIGYDAIFDYNILTGPKTKSTRMLIPITNIVIDHENKSVIFERECEEFEEGD